MYQDTDVGLVLSPDYRWMRSSDNVTEPERCLKFGSDREWEKNPTGWLKLRGLWEKSNKAQPRDLLLPVNWLACGGIEKLFRGF